MSWRVGLIGLSLLNCCIASSSVPADMPATRDSPLSPTRHDAPTATRLPPATVQTAATAPRSLQTTVTRLPQLACRQVPSQLPQIAAGRSPIPPAAQTKVEPTAADSVQPISAGSNRTRPPTARPTDVSLASYPSRQLVPSGPLPGMDCSALWTCAGSRLKVLAGIDTLMAFSSSPVVAAGNPFFVTPPTDTTSEERVSVHARQSYLGAVFSSDERDVWRYGGQVLTYLHDDQLLIDDYGLLVYYAWGELRSDEWRLAAGLQPDVFNPLSPEVIYLSKLYAAGNTGAYRGQLRVERVFRCHERVAVTCQVALSDPLATLVTDDFRVQMFDDGLPNLEGRVELGWGYKCLLRGVKQRPLRVGVSGMAGRLNVHDIDRTITQQFGRWAVGTDLQWNVTESVGVRGELFAGRGLGDYNGGILQTFHATNLEAVAARGGFLETFYYLTERLHTHVGFGIDDPQNSDVAAQQLAQNQTYFGALLCEIGPSIQVGIQIDLRETEVRDAAPVDSITVASRLLLRF